MLRSATNGTFTSYYSYNAAGDRVRKVVEKGNIREERLYLGNYERYRKYVNNILKTERQTVHIIDDRHRFALIDRLTIDNGITLSTATNSIRYQYDNHLGSASLELDQTAAIISYEEYHPFGTTSYRSGRTETEVSQKYSQYTPYQYAGNKPVSYIDLDGFEEAKKEEAGGAQSLQSVINIGDYIQNSPVNRDETNRQLPDSPKSLNRKDPSSSRSHLIKKSPSAREMQSIGPYNPTGLGEDFLNEKHNENNNRSIIQKVHDEMRQRDPVAYDLASSPGVQVGMAATVPGYALVTGGIQAYSGILSGNTTDIAIGGAQMIAGAFVRMPKITFCSTTSAAMTGMTDTQLLTRVAQKAETAIGGTGRFAGTEKHAYANNLLNRYQSIYGNRGLQSNQYLNGPVGKGFIDVVNH